ncbi:MAG: hypothetical protein A3C15_01400 [Candidatus Magasanikbacteria bacterium RIFCSPHIGHO2_02_FULL_50_9b]|uniref:HIT domain-containing protein n=1 Tax=Candidatus Magasanikbacteria bacterium RIFCSPHIGHO2_02_FULL_50_9b TaxID=1798682 RepID=A0A1F6M7J1_9BACT|nr:MAG: hypothetical protein A3C15_01400 [Candidatus Magasanikbacteria bacterium RIFCSPHIGHO2_02_FULL_50_9b]
MSCIFCKIVAGEIPCHKVFEDENLLAFLDIHPCNPGHTLVIPKQHFENLLETPAVVVLQLMNGVHTLAPRVVAAVGAHGFNLGVNTGPASGQVIMHTHAHIIPRFEHDGLVHWPTKEMTSDELHQITLKICKGI